MVVAVLAFTIVFTVTCSIAQASRPEALIVADAGPGTNGLSIGDNVRLKSGGPIMTVVSLHRVGRNPMMATCDWFDSGGQNHRADFNVWSLEKIEKPKAKG